jgi:hypothetical protein
MRQTLLPEPSRHNVEASETAVSLSAPVVNIPNRRTKIPVSVRWKGPPMKDRCRHAARWRSERHYSAQATRPAKKGAGGFSYQLRHRSWMAQQPVRELFECETGTPPRGGVLRRPRGISTCFMLLMRAAAKVTHRKQFRLFPHWIVWSEALLSTLERALSLRQK